MQNLRFFLHAMFLHSTHCITSNAHQAQGYNRQAPRGEEGHKKQASRLASVTLPVSLLGHKQQRPALSLRFRPFFLSRPGPAGGGGGGGWGARGGGRSSGSRQEVSQGQNGSAERRRCPRPHLLPALPCCLASLPLNTPAKGAASRQSAPKANRASRGAGK